MAQAINCTLRFICNALGWISYINLFKLDIYLKRYISNRDSESVVFNSGQKMALRAAYSSLQNKRTGPNKRTGWNFDQNTRVQGKNW